MNSSSRHWNPVEVEPADQEYFTSEVVEAELTKQGDVIMTEALIEQEPSV